VDRLCHACGDPAEAMLRKKPYCQECYAELALGQIAPPRRIGPRSGRPASRDETSPWWDDVVRASEEDH
jgi:hypothetical protein